MSVIKNFTVWGGGTAVELKNYASNYLFMDSVWHGGGFIIECKTSGVVFKNVEFADMNTAYHGKAYAELIQAHPEVAEVHLGLGEVAVRQGVPDRAEEALTRAITLDPALADGYAHLGWLLLNREEQDRAKERFLQALERSPRHPAALHGSGDIYRREGLYDDAANAYHQLLRIAPESAAPYAGLGKLYFQREAAETAVRYLEKAVERNSADPTVFSDLGQA